ncbi:MAG: polysaccharide lyase family 1 protein [Nocardioides sp.]|uniref:pectate lyase family protein n=1 Tax=Nocardioides sp. TaxID=35761 RepID=UPI0039E22C44
MPPHLRSALCGAALIGAVSATGLCPAPASASVSAGLPSSTTTAVSAVAATATSLAPADGSVAALPVPVGFGAATTGGAGGTVIHVTSAADDASQSGTLPWALAQAGPKWIVFDDDMTITLTSPAQVTSETTIDGRGHDVLITGPGTSGLVIDGVDNVIVEGLRLRDFGDTALTSSNDPYDAISVVASTRVWIDHNTLSEAGDKLIGIQDGTSGVTVSWNHFWDQEQTLQVGEMSTASADVDQTVTIADNWFDHVGYRMPVVSYGKAHVYNNYLDSWTRYAVRSERLAQIYLEANVFQAASSKKATLTTVAQTCNDAGTLCDSRKGFIYDTGNLYLGTTVTAKSRKGKVFDPSDAYSYTAAEASTDLATVISTGAGADPGADTDG